MPAPARPTPHAIQHNAISSPKGIVGHYTDLEIDALLEGLVQGGLQSGSGGTVYEQDVEPESGKAGDLWLSTPAADPGSVGSALERGADTKDLDAYVTALVRKIIAGGKEPPPDRDWSATVLANVSLGAVGLIEARLKNGKITLRGELQWTTSNGGAFTNVRSLLLDFPRPDVEYSGVVIGREAGVTHRPVAYQIKPDGMIALCPIGGKVTHIVLDGATAYV